MCVWIYYLIIYKYKEIRVCMCVCVCVCVCVLYRCANNSRENEIGIEKWSDKKKYTCMERQ
jgi:hypothetical protein